MGELKDSTINLKAFSQKFCGLIGFANPSLFNNKSERFLFEQQTEQSKHGQLFYSQRSKLWDDYYENRELSTKYRAIETLVL